VQVKRVKPSEGALTVLALDFAHMRITVVLLAQIFEVRAVRAAGVRY
jgi:hypothetical protein